MNTSLKTSLPVAAAILTAVLASVVLAGRTSSPGKTAVMAPKGTAPATKVEVPAGREVATLAAGCFWSMEATYKEMKGVDSALPGYAGGTVADPGYERVCSGNTGHAEAVNIVYDPKVVSFKDLVQVILTVRDPTTLNRQGPDEGTQYRSVIFTHSEEQAKQAREAVQAATDAKLWPNPIVTKVEPFTNFYRAEDYHLDYYNRHRDEPYCKQVIDPEMAAFHAKFKDKLKTAP